MTRPLICRACGERLSPPTGRVPGVLLKGSMPDRVVEYLHEHPRSELTAEEISKRFDSGVNRTTDVGKRLAVALLHGYIESVVSTRGQRVFRKPRSTHSAQRMEATL